MILSAGLSSIIGRMMIHARAVGGVVEIDPPDGDDHYVYISVKHLGKVVAFIAVPEESGPIYYGRSPTHRYVASKAREAFSGMGI